MSHLFMEGWQAIKGLDPVADAFEGTVYSDIVDMGEFERVAFIRHDGIGTTGTSTVTVEACSTITATATSAVPFHYRQILTGDTEGAITAATATGFTTTAGSSKLVIAEVHESAIAASGYRYVRAAFVQSVDAAVLGGVLILGKKKVQRAASASAID